MNNKIKYLLSIAILLILIVLIFFYRNYQTDVEQKNTRSNTLPKEQITHQINTLDGNLSNTSKPKPSNINPPKWAQELMYINENPQYNRVDKIQRLIKLLNENKNDASAVREILAHLSNLNPIEAVDDILPFLKNSDPSVQNAAIGALSNASLLTEQEQQLKKNLPENDVIRRKIAININELKNTPNIANEVKQAISSSYASTNPSLEDTKSMIKDILNQKEMSANESSYLATSILNGKDVKNTISLLDNKSTTVKDEVIKSIGNNIVDNPNVLDVLNTEQKREVFSFIHNNPPSMRDDDFSFKNDLWKNALNHF
ncbi:HEAT repeat domain-containing protein [Acinetobacter sp. P8-3-8]|uniref:HEAT repeat domain-containing protein n=1 Tax=Acinetobacter sp. P8-3-8 TaxID=1029823 RepID=UPI0002487FE5|nr:HEAT repeat domain-containing protein [Acinetobacter sp. P8-3-8]